MSVEITVYVLVLLMLPFVDQLYYTPCLPTLINNYLFNIPVNGILSNKIKLSMYLVTQASSLNEMMQSCKGFSHVSKM
jgi:hypothetical protein